jgi:putative tryptophan/tyrosine transport system substrate-binding protein
MKRREFIAGVGGAVAWPVVARAQQPGKQARRVAVLMGWDEFNPFALGWLSNFTERLREQGWTNGANLETDVRWATGEIDRMNSFARELVELAPDVILATTTPVTAAVRRATRNIPIIFAVVSDPVGAGFVASLPRPGGNTTGFINVEAGMASKWLDLLLQIAPTVKRVAIIFNPDTAPGGGLYFLPTFKEAAQSLKVAPIIVPVHNDAEIEAAITLLGREPGGGLVVMTDGFMFVHRATLVSAAAQSSVPVVSDETITIEEGGLLSYGADNVDIFQRAALYVDRVLRGANPGELPVQLPTKFEMVLNLKAANALGLAIPPSILLRVDEVIE